MPASTQTVDTSWLSILGTVAASIAASLTAGYYGLRKLRNDFSADGAERSANKWHQRVIERQDREMERLRNELETVRQTITSMYQQIVALQNENQIKQKIISEMHRELQLVKRGLRSPEDINTGIWTGH